VAITYGYTIGPQCLAWDRRTRLEKERKEEENQRVVRLEIISVQNMANVVLAKGATPEASKRNDTDLTVMIQCLKREGYEVMPKNNDGLLLHYRETRTRIVEPVTYQNYDEDDTARVATVAVGVVVPTDGVASDDVGSRTDRAGVASAAVGSRADSAGVASGDVDYGAGVASAAVGSRAARAAGGSATIGSPGVGSRTARAAGGSPAGGSHTARADAGSPTARADAGTLTAVLWSLGTVAGKPTFAAAAARIPDAAHASTIAQDQSEISNAVAAIGATDH
jgi:hypothetical protein